VSEKDLNILAKMLFIT